MCVCVCTYVLVCVIAKTKSFPFFQSISELADLVGKRQLQIVAANVAWRRAVYKYVSSSKLNDMKNLNRALQVNPIKSLNISLSYTLSNELCNALHRRTEFVLIHYAEFYHYCQEMNENHKVVFGKW